jgi:KAP family P-loop domain
MAKLETSELGTLSLPDAFNHEGLARSLLKHAETLLPGSVIAIQGPWGRGKTDVLKRICAVVQKPDAAWLPPLWINPWRYANPDLLTPLIAELVSRLDQEQKSRSTFFRNSAKAVLRAANAIAFKGLSVLVPSGELFEAASKPVDDFLNYLFEPSGKNQRRDADADPVAMLSTRFRELLEEFLNITGSHDKRIIICIDDLDRCLPDRQIAMLEAIHFLTSARAPALFIVALDSAMVKQAAVTHYKTDGFDTDQYLNKIFDLRTNLPTITFRQLTDLFDTHLSSTVEFLIRKAQHDTILQNTLTQLKSDEWRNELRELYHLPELRNPRIINRLFQNILLFINSGLEEKWGVFSDLLRTKRFFVWLAVSERWPSIREMMQYLLPETFDWHLFLICKYYKDSKFSQEIAESVSGRNFFSRLPPADRGIGVGQFFVDVLQPLIEDRFRVDGFNEERRKMAREKAGDFYIIDQMMVSSGL